MRWFVIFLIIANLVLFLWMRHDSLKPVGADLPPPEIGRLSLLSEAGGDDSSPYTVVASDDDPPPEPSPDETGQLVDVKKDALPSVPAEDLVEVTAPPAVASAGPPVQPDEATSRQHLDVAANAESTPRLSGGEPAVTVPDISCARVGPLRGADADALIAKLPPGIDVVEDVVEQQEPADGYYVLIPALPDRPAGLRMLEELKQAGFSDTWLFPGGELRNAISLGLFSRQESAERHAAVVEKKGFNVEIKARNPRAESRWLTMKWVVDDADPERELALPDGVSLIERDCP